METMPDTLDKVFQNVNISLGKYGNETWVQQYGNETRGYNSMGMRLEGITVWE